MHQKQSGYFVLFFLWQHIICGGEFLTGQEFSSQWQPNEVDYWLRHWRAKREDVDSILTNSSYIKKK